MRPNFSEVHEHPSFNPFLAWRPFYGASASSAGPGETPPHAASDQGLHCLLAECSIRI